MKCCEVSQSCFVILVVPFALSQTVKRFVISAEPLWEYKSFNPTTGRLVTSWPDVALRLAQLANRPAGSLYGWKFDDHAFMYMLVDAR